MTKPSAESVKGVPDRLDEETERLIKEFEDAATFDFGRDGFTSDARTALRSRIRELVEKSRQEGRAYQAELVEGYFDDSCK